MEGEKVTLKMLAEQMVEDEIGLATKKDALFFVTEVIDRIKKNIVAGKIVYAHGLGVFSVVDRAPRIGRNPMTGASVKVPAKKTVRFRVSKDLKAVLNPAPVVKKRGRPKAA